MSRFVANARMYAVTPAVEAAWQTLLARITESAGVDLDYVPYPAPRPLEVLWNRGDLGAVFMCGYPIAMRLADVVPLAAPIPAADWAAGRAVYRSDLIVRADSEFRTLEDTFGGRAGWTVSHSHSGFNAFRHHLLRYRTDERPMLYREMRGDLVTARRILDAVVTCDIDVGPLDGFWHLLIRRHLPELAAQVRVVESTDVAPIPALVASPALTAEAVARLKAAFVAAAGAPWFEAMAAPLLLAGFVAVDHADFARTLDWDRTARAAGYPLPA